jgi:hypothetical protein
MNIISGIVNFFTKPVADIVGGWQGRKNAAAQTVKELALLEGDLKKARITADIKRVENQDSNDTDYDQKVLDNRKYTYMDDFLILWCLSLVTMHFIPYTAVYMGVGWDALAKSPWWFQFTMLGIMISTLGLMRLFRMYTDNKFSFKKGK